MTVANSKAKIIYDMGDNKTETKTINNVNPEAGSAELADTISQFTALQNRTVKEVQRVDTTVISG